LFYEINQTQLNIIKFIIAFASLIAVYALFIAIAKPLFPSTSILVYIAIGVVLALIFFLLIPFWMFQFRGRE